MESNSDIKQAVQTLEEISDDEEMRRLAELREKAKLDEVSWTYNAEQRGKARGRQEGLKEGEARGRQEGLKEGEARGRQEGEKSRNAKKQS